MFLNLNKSVLWNLKTTFKKNLKRRKFDIFREYHWCFASLYEKTCNLVRALVFSTFESNFFTTGV